MPIYTDLEWTPDGDFTISESGDLAAYEGRENAIVDYYRDVIAHRLAASKSDWRLHSNISAGLDRAIGRANDQDTYNSIRSYVRMALTSDFFFLPTNLEIRVVDIGEGAVVIMIWLKNINPNKPIGMFAFDLQTGEFVSKVR